MRKFNFSIVTPVTGVTIFETGTYSRSLLKKVESAMSLVTGGDITGILKTPLNIEFEVQSFEGSTAVIPGYVRVYNLSADFYAQAERFVRGFEIELYAGVDTSSILSRKIGYSQIKLGSDLLIKARISNILGNFSSINPYIDFFFVVDQKSVLEELFKIKKKKADALGKEQFEPFSTAIPPKSPVAPFLVQALKQFTSWLVLPEPSLLRLLNPSMQTIIIMAKTIGELLWQFKKSFNIEAAINTKAKTITLYEEGEDPSTKIPYGAAIVSAEDLLAQPERLGPDGNTISVVTRLRPDISLGTIVSLGSLKDVIPSTAQLSQGMSGGFLSSFISTPAMFQLGVFRVTACTHKGNFYNMSPEGWCTMFTAVPIGGQSLLK